MDLEQPARSVRAALVTGAAGFLGSHLARRLIEAGARVRGMVRDPARASRLAGSGIELVPGDITVPGSLQEALEGVDTVFHCAALVTGDARPAAEFETANVQGAVHLFEACRRAGSVKRVVHVSSVAVYGQRPRGTVADESHPTRPQSAYAASKRASEEAAMQAHAAGLPVVVARPMWIYGADSPGVARLFDLVARGRMVTIGGGRNAIQPIAVEDAVEGLLACAMAPGVEGEVFNLAGPEVITMREFCELIARGLGVAPPRRDIPLPVAHALAWACERFYPRALGKPPLNREKVGIFEHEHAYSLDKARERLGWQPRVRFGVGAARVAGELRARGPVA